MRISLMWDFNFLLGGRGHLSPIDTFSFKFFFLIIPDSLWFSIGDLVLTVKKDKIQDVTMFEANKGNYLYNTEFLLIF